MVESTIVAIATILRRHSCRKARQVFTMTPLADKCTRRIADIVSDL